MLCRLELHESTPLLAPGHEEEYMREIHFQRVIKREESQYYIWKSCNILYGESTISSVGKWVRYAMGVHRSYKLTHNIYLTFEYFWKAAWTNGERMQKAIWNDGTWCSADMQVTYSEFVGPLVSQPAQPHEWATILEEIHWTYATCIITNGELVSSITICTKHCMRKQYAWQYVQCRVAIK